MNNQVDKLNKSTEHILVVDDEAGIRNSLSKVLERSEYKVLEAETAQKALKAISENPVSLIISDFAMPGMDGIALLKAVKEQNPLIEFILITGHGTIANYTDYVSTMVV